MKTYLLLLFAVSTACQTSPTAMPLANETPTSTLIRVTRTDANENEESGFVNSKGDTVIPFGKYQFCYTDTFTTCAIVLHPEQGWVGINQQEKVLFRIFQYDNGPDYAAEGLFRIVDQGKIGYANVSGQIVIAPQYKCAYPFENGQAKVSLNCNEVSDGEVKMWKDGEWFNINVKGEQL